MKRSIAGLSLGASIVLIAVLQGCTFGIGDLATYIPFTLHHFDPSLFSRDLLMETIRDHPVYIWKALAFFLHRASPESVFKALFFFQVIFNAIAVRLFYRQFFGSDRGWIIVLLTLAVGSGSAAMGRYGLNPYGYFHPGALAFGAMLLSYILVDRGSWIAGGLAAGAIFLFHPFSGIYASLFLLLRMLLDFRKLPRSRIAAGVISLLLASSGSWIPHVQKLIQASLPGFDKALWLELVRMRMQHSFFISQWLPERFIDLGIALFALWCFRRHEAFHRTLPLVMTACAAILAMSLAELFSIKSILQLQLARCSWIVFVLLSFYIGDRIWKADSTALKFQNGVWLALGYLFMADEPFSKGVPGWRGIILITIALGSLAFIIRKKPRWWRPLYIGMGFLMVLIITGAKVHERWSTTGRIYDLTRTSPWEDIQLWCRDNVPSKELIMTPVYIEGFRCLSWRGIYGSYKDGAPHNYCEKTVFRWWERMRRLGFSLPLDRGSLPRLYHENAAGAAEIEGIRYLIYDKEYVIYSGPRLYENARFGIIALEETPDPEFTFI